MTEDELERCHALLIGHVADHGTVPSIAGLARLWGFASKSSAARRVDGMIEAGLLEWSPDRRLRPGPAFASAGIGPAGVERREDGPDPLDLAVDRWSAGYEPDLTRAYEVIVRLRRLVRAIEVELTRTAATEGLSAGEVLVLDALFRVGPPYRIAPTDLKRLFLISLAGVAKRVDRLHALGLIDRVPNPNDGRGLLVQLNERGIAVLKRLVDLDRAAAHISWPLALPQEDYETLLRAIKLGQARIEAGADRPYENDRSHKDSSS